MDRSRYKGLPLGTIHEPKDRHLVVLDKWWMIDPLTQEALVFVGNGGKSYSPQFSHNRSICQVITRRLGRGLFESKHIPVAFVPVKTWEYGE